MAPEPAWLEVSLTVDGELAEAVAEVFSRFAPQGVVIESTQIIDTPDSVGKPGGPLRVCAYLPVDTEIEAQRLKLLEALWHLGQIQPLPEPTFTSIQETNWMQAWKEHYHPIPVGERLLVLPAWMQAPDSKRVPLRIDPGMAFGTGVHPSTQLALELLEAELQPDSVVIDLGCGSGILSIAAAKLGARQVLGVDVDPDALANARTNLAANQVEDAVELGLGSVPELLSGAFGVQTAPLVVANLLAHLLLELIDEGLAALLAPGGVLILSGILEEKEAQILTALEAHGLTPSARRQNADWLALAAHKTTP